MSDRKLNIVDFVREQGEWPDVAITTDHEPEKIEGEEALRKRIKVLEDALERIRACNFRAPDKAVREGWQTAALLNCCQVLASLTLKGSRVEPE